jgi:acetyl esterase/lipase
MEAPWRTRFRASRVSLPSWARDEPERLLYASNDGGKWELYAWDRRTDRHRRVTDRPEGTMNGRLDPTGEQIWWFDDERGSELGRWVVEPFDGGEARAAAADLPPAYSVGLALARDFAVIGSSTDDGSSIHLVRPGEPSRLLYQHRQAASVAGLSRDETLLCVSHAEHGDTQHRALRVIDLDGNTVGDLWDGPGLGLQSAGWSRVPGDQRLLVIHERADLHRPQLWSPLTGEVEELAIDLPGEVSAGWYPDASALLIEHDHRGRSELYRCDLATRALERLDVEPGTIMGATVRPDGEVWYGWTRSSTPPEVRADDGRVVLRPPGPPAPSGVAYTDYDAGGVHGFVAEPAGARPHPTVFNIHGGPTAHDLDAFMPLVQAWVDHGYAVVMVNYRGSTGYGRAWRDAIIGNPGPTELEDIAKVHHWAIASGLADPERIILSGGSWGGYLTLLGLGTQPERWSLGIAAVPVADWFAEVEDEMEPLRRYDEALFGGKTIESDPEVYRERSPIEYAPAVRVPVLITGGANDPRCPIRQIENYVARMQELEKPHEYYRFEAGHSSLLTDEQIKQMAMRLDFAARHLGTRPPL